MPEILKLEAPWPEVKEMLKEVNLELTDDDLNYNEQDAGPMLQGLAQKMKRTPEEIKAWIESVSFNRGKAG
jgi:hypothetical protein